MQTVGKHEEEKMKKCFKKNSSHKFGLFYLHAINSYEELILGRITVSKH